MTTPSHSAHDPAAMPRGVRRAGLAVLAALLSGAAYLIWARGEAIVVDLATFAGKVWCF